MLSRYYGVDIPINSSKGNSYFKALAQELIDRDNPGIFNQAIMEFGALQCKPKIPDCNICPFQNSCIAFDKKQVDKLPIKTKKKNIKLRYFNFLVFISEDGNTVLEQRDKKDIWSHLYQFPLIETAQKATYKTLKHTLETSMLEKQDFELNLFNETPIIHKLSHQHLHTSFWIVDIPKIPSTFETKSISIIKNYPVPILIARFLKLKKWI